MYGTPQPVVTTRRLDETWSRISKARTTEDFAAAFRPTEASLDTVWSSFSLLGESYNRILKVSSAPHDFLEIYQASNFRTVDPGSLNARFGHGGYYYGTKDSPFFRGQQTENLFAEMVRFGTRSGVALAIVIPGDAAFGCLTLTSDRPNDMFRREIAGLLPALLPVGRFLFSRWLAHLTVPDRPELSQREVDCLCLLAAGYRAERIGEILAISRATVDLHFANAKSKLKSKTRDQALARAVALGLVVP
jgi:DNA-binding CsgD family transcriptional regulator